MKNISNNSDFDLIRVQMNCADGSAEELIEKGSDAGSAVANDFRELIAWLRESAENRNRYNRLRRLDGLMRESTIHTASNTAETSNTASTIELDADGFAQRLKMKSSAMGSDSSVTDLNAVDSIDLDSKDSDSPDYQALFDQSDALEQELIQAREKISVASHDPLEATREPTTAGKSRSNRRWWIASAASVLTVALSITIALMWNPTENDPEPVYTAEMLCDQSLDWNPNGLSDFVWNQDVQSAPNDRLFPAHLIRHQARSWRRIDIEGDPQAIVYNLVPEGHLSELKAYLYVFKTDKDYQLPS